MVCKGKSVFYTMIFFEKVQSQFSNMRGAKALLFWGFDSLHLYYQTAKKLLSIIPYVGELTLNFFGKKHGLEEQKLLFGFFRKSSESVLQHTGC